MPLYEQATGNKVTTARGASIGNAPDSIPSRMVRGEQFDIVILADSALDKLIEQGKVQAGSRVDLARSMIGMSVRKGTPKPDISTVDALRQTLLNAKSIAYSASASGTYLSTELFQRLGVAEQIKDKAKKIYSERVGAVVLRGDAEIGFQQVSELLPFKFGFRRPAAGRSAAARVLLGRRGDRLAGAGGRAPPDSLPGGTGGCSHRAQHRHGACCGPLTAPAGLPGA